MSGIFLIYFYLELIHSYYVWIFQPIHLLWSLLSDIISTNLLCLILALLAGADGYVRGDRHRIMVSVLSIIHLIYIIIVYERVCVMRVCMSACKICLLEYGCSYEVLCMHCHVCVTCFREPSTAAMRATWTLGARRSCTSRSRCSARDWVVDSRRGRWLSSHGEDCRWCQDIVTFEPQSFGGESTLWVRAVAVTYGTDGCSRPTTGAIRELRQRPLTDFDEVLRIWAGTQASWPVVTYGTDGCSRPTTRAYESFDRTLDLAETFSEGWLF